jgi:ribosomal protein S12 methylthiotransferase
MRIGLVSLGCPKNLVDAEVMLGLAQQAGHELTANADEADVLVVNTCAFIDGAKQESVNAILEMAARKGDAPARRLVVTGCLAERYRDDLRREIPEIDAVLGTGDVPRFVETIEGRRSGPAPHEHGDAMGGPAPVTLFRRRPNGGAAPTVLAGVSARHRAAAAERALPTYLYEASTPRTLTTPRHLAYVKVAEGCDYNCSFCIIPALRGPYRSRETADVVREARALAGRGVKELLLISQDTTFYGIDRGERAALAALLRELDGIDGLDWIRLLYLYPTTITDEVLDVMAGSSKVCKYIDLPLQHSAEPVLRRMRRPGSRASHERLLARIRARVPSVTLRTTLIAGFPGETRAEFEDLLGFVRTVEFDHVGVFTYSHEEGTAAHALPDDVPAPVKARRRDRLMRVQRAIVARRHAARVGERARVMVDGPSPEHPLVVAGRLEGQAPEIDPVVFFTECDPSTLAPGRLVETEIVGARDYDLVVRPL